MEVYDGMIAWYDFGTGGSRVVRRRKQCGWRVKRHGGEVF